MKRLNLAVGIFAAAFALGGRANAQLPSGTNENTAIPIYFQEMVSDLGDVKTSPLRVYSITLSKNQQISATLSVASTAPAASLEMQLWSPGQTNLGNCAWAACGNAGLAVQRLNNIHSVSFTYTASISGVFYITVAFNSLSVNYTLEVTTPTPPSSTPNCSGGTLTGQVDNITYSLTLIAAGLPDSASVGGTQLCATCAVKAPAYPKIAEKMETAMGLNVPVALCYDGSGNINQITLKHP
jgi:hypothetical protein